MGEALVDDRGLGDEGDEAHRAVAGRAGEGVDLEELPQEHCRRAFAQRRAASVGGTVGAAFTGT